MGNKGSKAEGGLAPPGNGRERSSTRSDASAPVEKRFQDVHMAIKTVCEESKGDIDSRKAFERHMSGGLAGFGEKLYDGLLSLSGQSELTPDAIQMGHQRAFSSAPAGRIEFFWHVFLGEKTACTKEEFTKMLQDVYSLSIVGLNMDMVGIDDRVLQSLCSAAPFAPTMESDEVVMQLSAFVKWVSETLPALFVGVQNNIQWSLSNLLKHAKAGSQSAAAEDEARRESSTSSASQASAPASSAATSPFPPIPHKVPLLETKSQVFKPADLWVLSLCLPACFTTPLDRSVTNRTRADEQVDKSAIKEIEEMYMWELLYNSSRDGTSMNRFKHHVFGYTGPTVLVVRDTEQNIVGICADTRWDDNLGLFGGKDSRALALLPTFCMIDPVIDDLGADKVDRNTKRESLYFKEKGRNQVHGIGIGQAVNNLRVYIDADFNKGIVRLPKKLNEREFKIAVVEVWGCGGPKASADQEAQKAWEGRARERMLKVKRPGRENWLDNPDRAILEMGGVKVDHSERGDV